MSEETRRRDRDLPFGFAYADQILEPFCACGRVVSRCDGSRRGCQKQPRRYVARGGK